MVTGSIVALMVLIGVRLAVLRLPGPLRGYLDAGPWGDALAYYLQIQYYRHHSGSEPDSRCLFRGNTLHTPSWYHRFVLFVCSDAALWARPWLPNLVLYGLGAATVLLLADLAGVSSTAATLALLVVVFLAQVDNSRFDERTIHYLTIQPRLLGLLALSLQAAVFAVLPSVGSAITIGTLAVLVALNTSVFSRQVAYFTLPVAALLSWDAIPLLNLVLASALALLLNRAEFVNSFGAHWRYARWYFRNFYAPRAGSGLGYLVRRAFAPPLRFLPYYADSALALGLLLLCAHRMDDPFAERGAAMLGAAFVVCALTALRKFASLGECWRYVSFSCWMLTPLALVHAVAVLHIPVALACVAALGLLLMNLWVSFHTRADFSNPNTEVAALLSAAFPDRRTAPAVWWSAHYRYGSIPVALGCGGATFEIQGTDLSEQVMASLFARYPYLHCNDAFFDTHRVTHLLISKREWPVDLYGSMDQRLGLHRVLAENADFVILARACG
jgi:hypothetical protein